MRHTRGGAAAMLLLAAACAAAVVLREAARRPLGPPPSRLLTAASDGGARRQAQGSPPAPVPVSAPVAEPAPAPAAGGCFTAIPDHQILHEPPAPRAGVACRPFVAVVAPCTSRGKKYRDVAGTPYVDKFFQTVLKTLVQSEDVGYDVAFYIGYDAGDGIWDTDKARRDLPALLQSQVDRFYKKSVMEEIKSLDINANKHIPGVSVKMVKCQSKSMVEASNCVIGQLYKDGAEYWYRVNDDTQFVTSNWIRDFNAQLAAFDPPNVGAVGPTCRQGNTGIMTYDYVHRTHWEIFNFQYPKVLKNWWCDDWITNVYGGKRTKKLKSQEVKHLISATRYQVYSKDSSGKSVPKQLLPEAYKSATCSIDGYLDRKPEFAGKPRTINPGGRCTKGAGGKPQTPSECKKAPTGARVGGKEGWNWEKISSEHPMKAQWFACPVPGMPEDTWMGACFNGRTTPDPVSSCGDLCASAEGCNYFWIFDAGRCCIKTTWDESAGNRPSHHQKSGGWYRMVK